MSSSSSTELPKAGDHVSEPIINEEELRYLYASNVNVSNFVSVKLLDKSNYTLWKKQMLCLLDSQNLRGLVDTRFKLPEVKSSNIMKQYNSLVEGWIYGSLNEYMLKLLMYIEGPRYIWSALETICDPQEAPTGGSGSSSTELPKAGDHVSDQPINEEELRYQYASNVRVSNFVSVKLLDKSNYTLWKEQMLCLLASQNLIGLVDAGYKLLEVKSSTIMEQYKSLVKGWIYRSLNEDMLKRTVMNSGGPQEIWSALETICHPQEAPTGSGNSSTELPKAGGDVSDEAPTGSGSSSTELPKGGDDVSDQPISEEELRFLYASNVNVSNFVSVSLLTKSNYTLWKDQMLCLLDSENLRGFVDATVDPPEIKSPNIMEQYESLVKGWIFSFAK